MSLDDTVADTIGAIYDAAMAPERWVEALDRVCALFDGGTEASLNMEDFGPATQQAQYWTCSTIDRAMVDFYISEFALISTITRFISSIRCFLSLKPSGAQTTSPIRTTSGRRSTRSGTGR